MGWGEFISYGFYNDLSLFGSLLQCYYNLIKAFIIIFLFGLPPSWENWELLHKEYAWQVTKCNSLAQPELERRKCSLLNEGKVLPGGEPCWPLSSLPTAHVQRSTSRELRFPNSTHKIRAEFHSEIVSSQDFIIACTEITFWLCNFRYFYTLQLDILNPNLNQRSNNQLKGLSDAVAVETWAEAEDTFMVKENTNLHCLIS